LLADIHKVDDSIPQISIYLKNFSSKASFSRGEKYRLYRRYFDHTLDKVLETLDMMDKSDNESIFTVNFDFLLEIFYK
jgi:hypothetical protein